MPKQDPEDPSVKLVDQLYREGATRALDEPCEPDAEARRLAALGHELVDELDATGGVVRPLAADLDSDRIAAMPRDRLLLTVLQLHAARGEQVDDALALAADADLRATIRRMR